MTCEAAASSRPVSDFSIAAYFSADFSMRRTPSLTAFLARMASFKSESIRSGKVIQSSYGSGDAVGNWLLPRVLLENIAALETPDANRIPPRRYAEQDGKRRQ